MQRASSIPRICRAIIAWAIVFLIALPSPVYCATRKKKPSKIPTNVTAASCVLMDLDTKTIRYSKNYTIKRPPASTLKLLTALVALKHLDTKVLVTPTRYAVGIQPTKAGLSRYKQYTVQDLLEATLAASSNDAAIALAEAAAGSEAKFAVLMNEKARALGAKNSHFLNATGLPQKNQYTTAYDLALITRAALRNTAIKDILSKQYVKVESSDGAAIRLKNHNKMLWKKGDTVVLGKTGFTRAARHCFAGVIYGKNKNYVVVLLKSSRAWPDIEYLIRKFSVSS